jgi:rubrerythrin
MRAMADREHLYSPNLPENRDGSSSPPARTTNEDAMICERCGKAEMYRMHAVWRCPVCGFKTDCCGW